MDLPAFNSAPPAELTTTLLACCDVPAWAAAVRDGRPHADRDALLAAADAAARRFTPADVDRALDAHPRIGERSHREGPEAGWSAREQAGVDTDAGTRRALAEANRAYEERFGRVFLICATGLSAADVLGALRRRLTHDDRTEAGVVAEELRRIALLRLQQVVPA
ncbi:2-oxo-4-hydroxy-4-carboxy-5-ureidoimidazoline decarboxylase [Modestobacter sp. URMC 112]